MKYAGRLLGDRAIFSYENNNGAHPATDLAFFTSIVNASSVGLGNSYEWNWTNRFTMFPLRLPSEAHGGSWGLSNQPWGWDEFVHMLNGRYYPHGEMYCPVAFLELFIANIFSDMNSKSGAAAILFEPAWYFFDGYFPRMKIETPNHADQSALTYPPLSVGVASYRSRPSMIRLTHTFLNLAKGSKSIPQDLGDTFDRNVTNLIFNNVTNPPRNFFVTTIHVISSSDVSSFDFFVDGRKWHKHGTDEMSHISWSTDNQVGRIELFGDGVDEIMKVQLTASGGARVSFILPWGGKVPSVLVIPGTKDCPVTFVTAANLVSIIPPGASGDPDEIIVARKCVGSKNSMVLFSFFEMEFMEWPDDQPPYSLNFQYGINSNHQEEVLATVIGDGFSTQGIPVAVVALRPEATMITPQLVRIRDSIALVSLSTNAESDSNLHVVVRSGRSWSSERYTISKCYGGTTSVTISSGDVDCDGRDELLILQTNGTITAHKLFDGKTTVISSKQVLTPEIQNVTIFCKRAAILKNRPFGI